MRYKAWRSRDNHLHVIVVEGRFEDLPQGIRSLGPWVGSKEGEIQCLRPHYQALLAEQGFIVVWRHPYEFAPE